MGQAHPPAAPTVLLLQDEPILRMLLADLIEDAGCVAVEVRTAAEALQVLEQRADIRVVIADLDVRGSPMGMQLAALIRDRWPPVELMLTGTFEPSAAEMPVRGMFFGKPFDHRLFMRLLQRFTEAEARPI